MEMFSFVAGFATGVVLTLGMGLIWIWPFDGDEYE